MTLHRGAVFMTDDELSKEHVTAMKRTLGVIARLIEEGGCPACAQKIRHVAKTYRIVPLKEAP